MFNNQGIQLKTEHFSIMKCVTEKQEARLLKKKRKLEALANVSKLNDEDRENEKLALKANLEENIESDTNAEPDIKRTKTETSQAQPPIQAKSKVLSDEEYAELKRELNAKKRELKNAPKLRLKLFGDSASLSLSPNIRTPIFLTDIQHLIMYILFGGSSPCVPSRWCHLEKASKVSHTVVIAIDGLSLHHFSSYESMFEKSSRIFEHKLEIVMPGQRADSRILSEIIAAPLIGASRKELVEKYGSLEAAIDATKDPALLIQSIFPTDDEESDDSTVNKERSEEEQTVTDDEIIPRTQLLMSALQMVDEGYPLPLRGELANRYKDFVMTQDKYKEVTAKSPMYALDCEMCRTSAGINELTRISIINESHESIYETLVCPQNKIIDYLTPYSGITPEMMKNVTKGLDEVQADVRRILPADAVLVGQSLQSDLMAMRMMHPYVIDTSVIFNLSGDRRKKSKLQALASEFLGESIQKNPLGHDSIEDCLASLKLTKLKLSRGIDFGDAVLTNRRRFYESKYANGEMNINTTQSSSSTTTSNRKDRSTAVLTVNDHCASEYHQAIDAHMKRKDGQDDGLAQIRLEKCDSNKAAVKRTCEIALEQALTMTHLVIPEKYLEDEKLEKSFKKIDQWIATIWGHVAPNGLCVVIFGDNSNRNVTNGVALMQVK